MLVTFSGLSVLTVFMYWYLMSSQVNLLLVSYARMKRNNLTLAMTNRFYFESNECINRFYDCTFDIA